MKIKVLKKFKDKVTGEIRKIGDVFECSKERLEEIQRTDKSLVEMLDVSDEDGQEEDESLKQEEDGSGSMHEGAGHLDKGKLEEMDYNDLKKLAKDMGLLAKGSKEELVERIAAEQIEY